MATKKAAKRPAKKSSSANKPSRAAKVPKNEAISQLTADHARVKKMFKQYERLAKAEAGDGEKQQVASLICAELTARHRGRGAFLSGGTLSARRARSNR